MKNQLTTVINLIFPALICIALFAIMSTVLFLSISNSNAYAKSSFKKLSKTEKATTYITTVTVVNGKLVGKFDNLTWYFGKNADREFQRDCKCMNQAPDGYWIRNKNPKIRTF